VLLYGASFAPAATAVRILVLASLASNVVDPYTFVMQAQDEVARFIPVNVLRMAVYLAALAVLVSPAGAGAWLPWRPSGDAGAAMARLLLILFPAWVYVGWTRALAGIPFYRRVWVYAIGFAAAVATDHVAVTLATALGAPPFAREVLGATVAIAVYAVYLSRAHPDARENVRYTLGLITPRP
jgi:hypothetical protein